MEKGLKPLAGSYSIVKDLLLGRPDGEGIETVIALRFWVAELITR